MTTQVLKPSEIKMNGIGFTEPKVMASGGKNLYINYNKSKLVIQVPKMSMPYNMNCYRGPSGDQPPKYNINLSFKNMISEKKSLNAITRTTLRSFGVTLVAPSRGSQECRQAHCRNDHEPRCLHHRRDL